MSRLGHIADASGKKGRGSTAMPHIVLVVVLSAIAWDGAAGFSTRSSSTARSAEAWRISRQPPRLCRASRPQGSGRHSLRPELHSLHTHAAKPNGAPSVSAPIPVEELRENDPPSLVPRQPPPKAVKTPHVVDSGEEGEFIDSTAAFAPGGGGDAEDPSMGAGQDSSVLRQMSALVVLAGLAAVAFDYEHGMAGFHWFQNWAGNVAPHFPVRGTGGALAAVHFTPLKSFATGLGAGFTRAVSRTFTFPLDTLKTRSQVSRLGAEDRAALPLEMRTLLDRPATKSGVFRGFSAFLAQAGPANAVFFMCYDALNALGAAALLPVDIAGGGSGSGVGILPTVLHLGASSLATVPTNLVRTPAEVVKQRLQVGQENGNALQALQSILRGEGVGGLFVGGREQLIREIPFNAIQFAVYECLKSSLGSSEIWADAALGAASSALAAVATQPVDTVKTRVMTKSTGGAFYFWGQEFVSLVFSRAGL
eukprot:jgi/Undpi1/4599/HiC_scaffold_18.g07953.m1